MRDVDFVQSARADWAAAECVDAFKLLIRNRKEQLIFDDWARKLQAVACFVEIRECQIITFKRVALEIVAGEINIAKPLLTS